MKAKLIAIAALAALSAGTAQALSLDDGLQHGTSRADIISFTRVTNDITVRGTVGVWGWIKIKGEAAAVVDSGQSAAWDSLHVGFFSTNRASVSGDALRDAQGNVGVNVAAGAGNVQSNDGALAAVDASKVFASAMVFNKQSASNDTVTLDPGALNTASLSGNALRGAKGNIGVNIAAGAGNVQENALAAASGKSGKIAKATIDNEQSARNDRVTLRGCFYCEDPTNSATLSGNALRGAIGNVGVNIAAGASNVQHNGLAIATTVSH